MTLDDFYVENYHIVYGYLLSLCQNPAMAEDLTSETFLRALRSIDRYDSACKPSTWLCEIGKNLYLNEQGKGRRQVPLEKAPPGTVPSAEETAERREALSSLLRFAGELPEQHQRVFFMRIEGLSFREIGSALGKSENWARVTFFRAKNKVLQRWEASET